jgi:glyoxylase-like metal-dependent hydrolase (beta-lactamase superfamily II)
MVNHKIATGFFPARNWPVILISLLIIDYTVQVMTIQHDILIEGNSLSFRGGFFGFSAVVLIKVPGYDPVLFDTGHHSTRLMLLEALKQRSLATTDIKTVFLSHLHFDHINNVDLFTNAKVYAGAKEWHYAQKPSDGDTFCSVGMNGYLQSRLELLDDEEGELLPGLFYRFAPGHTPGSYLLHYVDGHGKRVVIAGDACKTYRELVSLSAGHEFDPTCRASATLAWIRENADIVVPGHFPQLHRTESGWMWDQLSTLELIVR